MTAHDLREYLRSLDSGWVNWEKSVDTFKAGDPATVVAGIAVAWKANIGALKAAHGLGCNVFVGHEPLYYDHTDSDASYFADYAPVRAKRDWIAAHGMVVMRCHDVWDQVDEIGICASWGRLLGFGQPLPESDRLTKVFDVTGRTALDVAQQVARAIRPLGQECVQLVGEPDQPVTRLATGTGAITRLRTYVGKFHADIGVVTEDGYNFCCDGGFAQDSGIPLVVVNHCAAEDYGMRLLAEHLRARYPAVPVHFLPQADTLRLVRV